MTLPAPATASPADRVKACYAQRDWAACVAAIDEALAQAPGAPQGKARIDLLLIKARVLIQNLKRPAAGLEAIEAAHLADGGDRAVLETLARLRQAAGSAASAFAIQKGLLRSGDPTGRAARGLFDILMRRGRYAAAARLAPVLAAQGPPDGAVARDLAEIALVRGDPAAAAAMVEIARRSLGGTQIDSLAAIAASLKSELAARAANGRDSMAGHRHLAVSGAAYCGSTTLGVVLGSMPAWAFAGETHWLTNVRTPALGLESILTTQIPPARWPIACRVCGPGCASFDPAFRRSLATDPTGWYARIADRLGTANLVTTDKNLQLYWEKDPLFRFDHLILYKSPVQHLRSMLKQEMRHRADAPLAEGWVGANLDRWGYKYLGYLKTIRQTGRRVALNWEAFVAEPARHMRRLADLLDIPLEPACLDHIRFTHFIGGNVGVDVRGLAADPRLALRASNAPALPAAMEAEALAHPFAGWVMRVLEGEYRRDFSGAAP